jgi:hypothetical protein
VCFIKIVERQQAESLLAARVENSRKKKKNDLYIDQNSRHELWLAATTSLNIAIGLLPYCFYYFIKIVVGGSPLHPSEPAATVLQRRTVKKPAGIGGT